jgi:hypothetical protein
MDFVYRIITPKCAEFTIRYIVKLNIESFISSEVRSLFEEMLNNNQIIDTQLNEQIIDIFQKMHVSNQTYLIFIFDHIQMYTKIQSDFCRINKFFFLFKVFQMVKKISIFPKSKIHTQFYYSILDIIAVK